MIITIITLCTNTFNHALHAWCALWCVLISYHSNITYHTLQRAIHTIPSTCAAYITPCIYHNSLTLYTYYNALKTYNIYFANDIMHNDNDNKLHIITQNMPHKLCILHLNLHNATYHTQIHTLFVVLTYTMTHITYNVIHAKTYYMHAMWHTYVHTTRTSYIDDFIHTTYITLIFIIIHLLHTFYIPTDINAAYMLRIYTITQSTTYTLHIHTHIVHAV